MIHQGEVINTRDNTAYVAIARSKSCKNCKMCGMSADASEVVLDIPNTVAASVGDIVSIEFSGAESFRSTIIAYVVPLFVLILGTTAGYYIAEYAIKNIDSQLFAALFGLGLTALTFISFKFLEPRFNKRLRNTYHIIEIVGTHGNVS